MGGVWGKYRKGNRVRGQDVNSVDRMKSMKHMGQES